MSTATDWIPSNAKIDVAKINLVENYASDEEIVEKVKSSVHDYNSLFVAQRQPWTDTSDGIWPNADAAFRTNVNDTAVQSQKKYGANEASSWERAKTGTSLFYRHVTQMAANGFAVQSSSDTPFKYSAIQDDDIGETPEQAKERADNLNMLAKWSMKKDNFDIKSIEFWTQIRKYGNTPVMIEWLRTYKTIEEPNPDIDSDVKIVERQVIDQNRPVFSLWAIEDIKADVNIGNIQDQECVICNSVVGLGEIVNGIEQGFYRDDLLADLGKAQQWNGSTLEDFDLEDKAINRGFTNTIQWTGSGRYRKWEVYINLPISEGKWEEEKNVPVRYRVTIFGNDPTSGVVARVERNQEPDDTIPIEMIHGLPDDSSMLYHISNFEVSRSNLAVETTIKRQIIDSNTTANKPGSWEIRGEVEGNNRTHGPDLRLIMDTKDSYGFLKYPDLSPMSMALLDYIVQENDTANSIDKNMKGESFGARTSAGEAGTIAKNSSRPSLVNIKYVMEQLMRFVGQRYKIGWENNAVRSQVIRITNENDEPVQVSASDIEGEFDIVIDVMKDAEKDAQEATKLIAYGQLMESVEGFKRTTDFKGLNEEISERMIGTSKFVIGNSEGDAEANARNNLRMILEQGQFPQLTPGMNLSKHLAIYKSELIRWAGAENPNLTVLEQVIAQIENQIQQTAIGGGQQGGSQQVMTDQEANRQGASGSAGGIQ